MKKIFLLQFVFLFSINIYCQLLNVPDGTFIKLKSGKFYTGAKVELIDLPNKVHYFLLDSIKFKYNHVEFYRDRGGMLHANIGRFAPSLFFKEGLYFFKSSTTEWKYDRHSKRHEYKASVHFGYSNGIEKVKALKLSNFSREKISNPETNEYINKALSFRRNARLFFGGALCLIGVGLIFDGKTQVISDICAFSAVGLIITSSIFSLKKGKKFRQAVKYFTGYNFWSV